MPPREYGTDQPGQGVEQSSLPQAESTLPMETSERLPVRVMCAADVPAVCAIERHSFSNPWTAHTFHSLLGQPGWSLRVVDDAAGQVRAYAAYWWVGEEAELASIAVREEDRGHGLGGALLDQILASARTDGVLRMYLELRRSNHAAARLYASRGFELVGVRADYYEKPKEDARVLVKTLARR